MLIFYDGRHIFALEVIAGTGLPVQPNRTLTGHYVHVSTSNSQWNTTIKAAERAAVGHSVSWNETLNIHGSPLTLLQWLTSIFSRTSETIHLEIRALDESGPEIVCAFETTFEQLLGHDGQSITLSAIDNQDISLTLKVQRSKTTSSSNSEMCPRGGNIVIFGETGSGKSSLVNKITQLPLAKTSNDALGCTSTPERYPIEIFGKKYILIDTPGLNEVSNGTVPDAEAKELLKNLLCELMSSRSDDIGLLVYCVGSGTHPRTFVKAYNKFYSGICHNKVPIILVVEGLYNESGVKSWWNSNGEACRSRGMHFANDPSVLARQEIDYQGIPDDVTRVAEPSSFLRNLIVNNYSEDLAVDTSWSKRIARTSCTSSGGHSA
ncbi:P-loop containing nucleoside triphosphate hydrolase protein [Suillus lakei]|nr:P-loop containing nucleoside triphosphate hydrolase protein [Suillus lakei]